MSFTRAKRLLSGIRLHHLGFGFFWAVSFIVSSGLQSSSDTGEDWWLYLSVKSVITFLVVGFAAWLYRKRKSVLPPWLALAAGFMLSGGALLYFLCFSLGYSSPFVALASGVLIGCANALFFLLWQTFFVTEGQQRAIICIPLSAVLSIGIYVLSLFLPLLAVIFVAVAVLPFLAMLTLHTSLGEIELFPITVITRPDARAIAHDLWRPIFCVCVIGFLWKLVSQFSHALGSSNDFTSVAVLAGFGAAALLVALFELFSTRGFDIMRTYQILFPVITGIFLIPTFFGIDFVPILPGMLLFGFEVVNLLLLITCAVYASKKTYSPVVMYGICVFPTLVFMALGDSVGAFLNPTLAYDFSFVVVILFLSVYLLSLALVFVARGNKPKAIAVPAEDDLIFPPHDTSPTFRESLNRPQAKDGTDLLACEQEAEPQERKDGRESGVHESEGEESGDLACARVLREKGLSPREIEVVELLIKGNSVAAISRKLFISENTTRGHTKNIYVKLNVHSRQELIDMSENGLFG